MRDAAARMEAGGHVAVLFGPERAGLENDDIAQANALISVPVNPEFPSLNLAQCVLLVGYEWLRASAEETDRSVEMAGTQRATGDEVIIPDHKAASLRTKLRNMWCRMPLTRADVQTLHGMLRQMVRWAGRG